MIELANVVDPYMEIVHVGSGAEGVNIREAQREKEANRRKRKARYREKGRRKRER